MALVFFDIDGTLWDQKQRIEDSVFTAFERLRKNGHQAFLCSGRARSNIGDRRLLSLGFDGIIAACGCHVEMGGKILYEKIISPELTRKLVRVLEECHLPIVLEGPDYHWIDKEDFSQDPYVLDLFARMGDRALLLNGYTEDIRINKMSGDVLPDTDYDRVKRELGNAFDFLEHEGNVVEFVPKGTSKATGIAWLCEYLGADRADTYAVGDSVNDLDMLRYVGHGIAMGNGSAPAKAAAEYVTSDIHDDGVLRALEHFGLA